MTSRTPSNTRQLSESNQLRSLAGSKRQVARAESALIVLHRANLAHPTAIRQRYEHALRFRLLHPDASLAELAAMLGMSKHRYWRLLSRALDCADKLEAKQEQVQA